MKLTSQTPLTGAGLSQAQVELLRSLWITSLDELLSVLAATNQGAAQPEAGLPNAGAVLSAARLTLPAARLNLVSQARRGGGLGCSVDPQLLDDFKRQGRIRPAAARPQGAFEAKLPDAVRLMDKMPPIRNQGQRGTCVAFGTVALREFLLGASVDLSEQFLYWACKELDGSPGPGTHIHSAMTALAEYGVCEESSWPYCPDQTSNEGQGPPPNGAREDAKKFTLSASRTVEPNLVLNYKHVLAGVNGNGGMPVTFGTLVFDSWYMSPETHRTGKLTLPLPKEQPTGGHAMCVVGYVDDADVPGGGYFIVRNSWGAGWAAESPEAPGHALLPYEYVERYAFEAFTGPLTAAGPKSEAGDPAWRANVCVLDRDARDAEGKLLPAGTAVVFDPGEPGVLREDTPGNRAEFAGRDRTWTAAGRERVWFPAVDKPPEALALGAARARAARAGFLAAVEENLVAAPGQPIPAVSAVPWWFAGLAWEPKIKEAELAADLGGELTAALAARSGTPADVAWPESWRAWLGGLNALRVYSLRGMTASFHVIVAAAAPVRFAAAGKPELIAPGQETADLIAALYRDWCQARGEHPTFVFYTLGAAQSWPDTMAGQAAGDHWLVLSSLKAEGGFATRVPPRYGDRLSLSDFLDRLAPQTRRQRTSLIKAFVDDQLTDPAVLVDVDLVRRRLGFRRTHIREAFADMQNRSGYHVYKTHGLAGIPDGLVAIRSGAGKGDFRLRPLSAAPRIVWQVGVGILIMIAPQALGMVLNWAWFGTRVQMSALGASLVTAYLSSLVIRRLTRLKDDKE